MDLRRRVALQDHALRSAWSIRPVWPTPGCRTIRPCIESGNHSTAVAYEGDAVPDGDGEFAAFSNLRFNNHSDIVFSALLRNTDGLPNTPFAGSSALDDSGIYLRRTGGELVEIAREGALVPSGDARYGRFADAFSGDVPRLAFNDNEQVAFRVAVFDTGHDESASGIYIASPEHVQHVVRTGEGYEGGVLRSFEHPALNNVGLAAFIAELEVGQIAGDEGPQPLLRKMLLVTNGDERATAVRQGDVVNGEVVLDFVFNNDPGGQTNGFSDNGVLAYEVTYESGLHAINAWAPELTLRRSHGEPNLEMAWDDQANWRFGITPTFLHEVALDVAAGVVLHGPAADTTVKALSIGHGEAQRLMLGTVRSARSTVWPSAPTARWKAVARWAVR